MGLSKQDFCKAVGMVKIPKSLSPAILTKISIGLMFDSEGINIASVINPNGTYNANSKCGSCNGPVIVDNQVVGFHYCSFTGTNLNGFIPIKKDALSFLVGGPKGE
jgi:hypothetical protein